MKTNKILSIVLPTYNRADYLPLTLHSFKAQMERNHERVSFMVCNNASTDNTSKVLREIHEICPYFEYINFDEHVDVGYSITRANNTATGEYVLMWGDDDLPVPYFIDMVLNYIEEYEHPNFIHYNRLCGYDDHIDYINKLTVVNNHVGNDVVIYNSMNAFLARYSLDITFLSSIIFKREIWMANQNIDTSSHFGYEFLGKILKGITINIIYIQYPLCIQRKPMNRPWMNKSPYYRFIGIPNMYNDFEKWGLITSAKELWMKRGNTMRDFIFIMAQTSIFKSEYRPLYRKMLASQPTVCRKLLTLIFIYIMPSSVYKFARKIIFKR